MNNNSSKYPDISLFKKLLFGLIFFSLIVLLLEFLLSFTGLEKYDKEFMPKSSYPIFVPGKGELSDYYLTSPYFSRFMNEQKFLRKKPAGLVRIFIVGGSAAFAWPYTEEYGFSGYIRRALDITAPGKFEIVNAGGMSFGSHRVLDVLGDIVQFEPDLVIIYSGNNEYVERNVLPEQKKATSQAIEEIGGLLGHLNLYRAVRLVIYRVSPSTFRQSQQPDITDIRADLDVERGALGRSSSIDREVLESYARNITSMKDILVQNNVKGIFSTVPTNISGWLPTVADPKFKTKESLNNWLELSKKRDEAFSQRNTPLEAEVMRDILSITPDDAGMRFNYGKVLWNLGKLDESYNELTIAKDLDERPMRALSSFNDIIRKIVNKQKGIYVQDLERVLREKYLEGIAKELYLDYCHFNERGHKLVSEKILPVIKQVVGEAVPLQKSISFVSKDDKALTKENYIRAHELYAQAITYQNNQRYDKAIEAYMKVIDLMKNFSPALSNLAFIYFKQGLYDKSKENYILAVEADHKNIEALMGLGFIYLNNNELELSEDFFRRAIQSNPYSPTAFNALGDIAMRQSNLQNAILFYNKALSLGRDSARLRRSLGAAYLRAGDTKNAMTNWQAALEFNPYDQETKALMEKYSE